MFVQNLPILCVVAVLVGACAGLVETNFQGSMQQKGLLAAFVTIIFAFLEWIVFIAPFFAFGALQRLLVSIRSVFA